VAAAELVIAAACASRVADPRDRTTRVFFGDAAAAVVLTRTRVDGAGLLSTTSARNWITPCRFRLPAPGQPHRGPCWAALPADERASRLGNRHRPTVGQHRPRRGQGGAGGGGHPALLPPPGQPEHPHPHDGPARRSARTRARHPWTPWAIPEQRACSPRCTRSATQACSGPATYMC
jgi:3-Oxoacyl-[acyl-carrier-protein (ACP)] synthase III